MIGMVIELAVMPKGVLVGVFILLESKVVLELVCKIFRCQLAKRFLVFQRDAFGVVFAVVVVMDLVIANLGSVDWPSRILEEVIFLELLVVQEDRVGVLIILDAANWSGLQQWQHIVPKCFCYHFSQRFCYSVPGLSYCYSYLLYQSFHNIFKNLVWVFRIFKCYYPCLEFCLGLVSLFCQDLNVSSFI